MTCFVFESLEEKRHGFKKIESMTLEKIIKTVSSFVDDTDLLENGQGCGEMMNEMLNDHTTLYETIGGKTESRKSVFLHGSGY